MAQKRKMRQKPKWTPAVTLSLTVLAALVFCLLFGSGLSLAAGGREKTKLDLGAANGEGVSPAEGGGVLVQPGGGWLEVSGLDVPATNLLLQYHSGAHYAFPVEVALYMNGDDAYAGGSFLADKALLAPRTKAASQVLALHSNGNLHHFRLEFAPSANAWTLDAATVNGGGFSFNTPLFLLLLVLGVALWAALTFGLHRTAYDDANRRHRWAARSMAAFCALVMAGVFLVGAPPGRKAVMWRYDPALLPAQQQDEYPGGAFYSLLLDAFLHRQTDLRVPPGEVLATAENPYDRSQRAEDTSLLWDASYYNGKYYCYFGPAPVLFYAAFYLVTRHQPSPGLACTAAGMLGAVLLWAALRQLLSYYKVKTNVLLLLLSIPALVFGSLAAMLANCADAYAQPYLWAGAALCGMVWLLYSGLGQQRRAKARLCFAGAGVAVVMVAASRPSQVLLCLAFALPPAVDYLRKSSVKLKDKLWDVAALVVPVAAGAALLMTYNAVRFASPFEFGQQYQLTVGDMRLQPFRWQPLWLAETLRFYLFQPLGLTQQFPFIEAARDYPLLFGNRFYSDPFFGLLNIPLYWALFALPFWLAKQPLSRKIVAGLVLGGGAFIWWFDFSIGNFLYRYLADASFAFALLAVVALLGLCGRPALPQSGIEKAGATLNARLWLGGVVLVCTSTNSLLLAFATDRQMMLVNHPEIQVFLNNMLRLR